MGAGSGSGGLYPNPGEPLGGAGRVVVGWKGDQYANAAPPNVEAVEGLAVAQQESGEPGAPAADQMIKDQPWKPV
jgi:hypothetical protein